MHSTQMLRTGFSKHNHLFGHNYFEVML